MISRRIAGVDYIPEMPRTLIVVRGIRVLRREACPKIDHDAKTSKNKKARMSQTSNRLLLGLGLAGLILDGLSSHPALATDKVSLFRIITHRDEIVIGLSKADLAQLDIRNAGDIARQLTRQGSLGVWQYGVRKTEAGALEQVPMRRIGLMAHDALRIEPYTTPLKVVPPNLDMAGQ